MNDQATPILIFTYGNPSRGDDALGPAMFDLLEKHKRETGELDRVELLTDFQLQIEHAAIKIYIFWSVWLHGSLEPRFAVFNLAQWLLFCVTSCFDVLCIKSTI